MPPLISRALPAVDLAKDLARALRRGHPWVFREALRRPPTALPSGVPVLVRDRSGRPLVWGFWDAESPIAVRVLGQAPAPPDPRALVRTRLQQALAGRLGRLDRSHTNAFRWVHGEGDLLPGVHVDLYDDVATVRCDGAGARGFYAGLDQLLAEAAAPLRLRAVVDRQTRGAAGTAGAARGSGLAQEPAPEPEQEVLENGLRFGVDLRHGQKGGLFLDQRENRAEVGRLARGLTVLNLFGYTGGFSLYAAAGGARRTDTVDAAAPALEAARRNFTRNGLPLEAAGLHAGDAFAFLEAAAARGQRWDLVISDPPSFAPSQKALPAARRAYRRLHALAVAVVAPGGIFCPASCSSHFPRDEFLASVADGVSRAGRRFRLDSLRGAGFDHPVLAQFPEGDYLKFAVGRVE